MYTVYVRIVNNKIKHNLNYLTENIVNIDIHYHSRFFRQKHETGQKDVTKNMFQSLSPFSITLLSPNFEAGTGKGGGNAVGASTPLTHSLCSPIASPPLKLTRQTS